MSTVLDGLYYSESTMPNINWVALYMSICPKWTMN